MLFAKSTCRSSSRFLLASSGVGNRQRSGRHFAVIYSLRRIGEFFKLIYGSHVALWNGYPFHLIRNSKSLGSTETSNCWAIVCLLCLVREYWMSLQPRILSASNSISLWLLSVTSSFLSSDSDGNPSGPTGGRRSESGC